MSNTYTIETQTEAQLQAGLSDFVAINSTTDKAAIAEMRAWLSNNPTFAGNVFLGFYRASDGQRGYINSDGASATGKSWR